MNDVTRTYSARWLADSGVSVGICRDVKSNDELLLLTDPRGEVFAVIRRDRAGRLTPLGREDFQRVVRQNRASQAFAEQLLQVSPASGEDEDR